MYYYISSVTTESCNFVVLDLYIPTTSTLQPATAAYSYVYTSCAAQLVQSLLASATP